MTTPLRANAWRPPRGAVVGAAGDPVRFAAELVPDHKRDRAAAPPGPPDPDDASDPRTGWGLVLPWVDGHTDEEARRCDDAPEPIQRLFAARPGAKVLRYRGDPDHLRDPGRSDPPLATATTGNGPHEIPLYLCLAGGPDVLPWSLQHTASLARRCPGRLDLEGAALARYVDALLSPPPELADPLSTLSWSVTASDDPFDITRIMRGAIADPFDAEIMRHADTAAKARRLRDAGATGAEMQTALRDGAPAFVLTTSHGDTDPKAPERLGVPIDARGAVLDHAAVAEAARAAGTIWYAHACCSGGSADASVFRSLLTPGDDVAILVEELAALGARSSPMAHALLGATRPARAFIGHVEPTFNWTLADPETGHFTASTVAVGLIERLYGGQTVARALRDWYSPVGALLKRANDLLATWDDLAPDADVIARRATVQKLTAFDRASVVLYGDPSVTLVGSDRA